MTPDQMRDASLLELFRLEAEAQTQVLNAGLMALERSPTQADQLEACMRAAHSLKGAARIVGLDAGVRVAHVMEDCLVEAQDGRLLLQSEHIDALLQGCDLLLRIGTPPAGDAGWAEGAGREEIDGLVQRLEGLVRSGLPLARAELPATTPGLPEAAPEAPPAASAAASDDNDEEPAGQAGGEQAEERRSRVLRVTAERLDRLLDISSKSLVEFQRIKPLADSLQRLRRLQSSASRALDVVRETVQETALDPQAQAMLGEARQLIGECQQMLVQHIADLDEFAWQGGQRAQVLYDAALASRMRPFADVLSGQARMVRDLGRSLGKQVRLLVEGESTQVDRDVLEKLEAPLTHLLRNAVDHGIEAPETRLAAGKPAEGRITIRARHHAGMLVLELSDDGGGIDLQRLRETVLNRQFATAETAAQLSEEELLAFLFLPGFSMREQVTEVSGRGVGLDAVQHMVRQLRGGVRMEQRQGQGTLFHVEVPLTLSVVRSLVVEIGEEAYAFPLAHIERMCELEAEEIVQLEGRQHFWYEGRHVGLVSAAQLLQRPESSRTEGAIPVVVVRDRDAVYGVAVERFVGERTLVVMPLDPRLGKVRDVSAGALLDDGSPVLILDVEDLLHSVGKLLSSGRLERIDRSRRQAGGARQRLVAIGASAGGPASLAVLLKQLPASFNAAVVLVQHVDEVFAGGMAEWLASESKLPVRLARDGEPPIPGQILLAGTNNHIRLLRNGSLVYTAEPRSFVYRPSIDVFFESVANYWRGDAVGVLLTGMGRDGAQGLKQMRERGFLTIAQDQASCAVYGMPKAAAAIDAAVQILSLEKIAPRLAEVFD